MTPNYSINKSIVFIINTIIVGVIIFSVLNFDSCKSPIIFLFFYPLLTLINIVITIILVLIKSTYYKIYKQSSIALIILFLPLVLIISEQ